jgi:hypothetical protein
VQVYAHVRDAEFDYEINGALIEKFDTDRATGHVVGTIPVLHLMAVGPTEAATRELLGKTFVEFCEVEIERGRFWPTLYKRGFVVADAAQRSKGDTVAQYLVIVEAPVEPDDHRHSTYLAEEQFAEEQFV